MPDHDYVLVIHGTWNPPDSTSPRWHQLDEGNSGNFCCQLNDRLSLRGMGRPVWRPDSTDTIGFGWSGANRHEDRVVGGSALAALIKRIVKTDPTARIHFI